MESNPDSWPRRSMERWIRVAHIVKDTDFCFDLEIVSLKNVKLSTDFQTAFSVYQYWLQLPSDPPHRRQVDPVVIGRALLPSVGLIEVIDGGAEYRWKIFRALHAEEYGADLSGSLVSKLDQICLPSIRRVFDVAIAHGEPVFCRLTFSNQKGHFRRAHGAVLPLADDAGGVGALLTSGSWG